MCLASTFIIPSRLQCELYAGSTQNYDTQNVTENAQSYLNLSCPAVSQICSLMRLPGSISTRREKKSTPTVGSDTCAKRPSVKRLIRQDLPTVESPMTISLNWYSHIASISHKICRRIRAKWAFIKNTR